VPIRYSEEYVKLNRNAELIKVENGDHGLATPEVLEIMEKEMRKFYQ